MAVAMVLWVMFCGCGDGGSGGGRVYGGWGSDVDGGGVCLVFWLLGCLFARLLAACLRVCLLAYLLEIFYKMPDEVSNATSDAVSRADGLMARAGGPSGFVSRHDLRRDLQRGGGLRLGAEADGEQ